MLVIVSALAVGVVVVVAVVRSRDDMTKRAFADQLYMRVPEVLVFSGTTDSQGRLILDFGEKEIILGLDYEICVEKFSLDATQMFNVLPDQYNVTWQKGGTDRTVAIKPTRLVFVADVLNMIQRQLDFVKVTYGKNKVELDFKGGILVLPTPVARTLKLCDKDGNQTRFHRVLNPGYVPGPPDGESFELDATRASESLVLPIDLRENIWNEISVNSFQAVFIYSDLVVTEIVGGSRVPNLGIYTFQEERSVNVFEDPSPLWRRISRRNVRDCYVQLADSRGKMFNGIKASIQCRLRKRNIK